MAERVGESSLDRGCTCDGARLRFADPFRSGCPVHSPHEPKNPTCDICKPYPGDPCVCGLAHA